VYICISISRGSTAVPTCIHDLCIDRPPFSPVQMFGMAKERMCLSCSSEAVPYDFASRYAVLSASSRR
jgi:hypothetical protein